MNQQPGDSRLISHLAMAMTVAQSLATAVFGVAAILAGKAGTIVIAPSVAGDTKLARIRLEWGEDGVLIGVAGLLASAIAWTVARRFPVGIPCAALAIGVVCTSHMTNITVLPPPTVPATAGVWTVVAAGLGMLALATECRRERPDMTSE